MPQLSLAVAEPRAALIAAVVGLQPRAPFAGVPVAVIVGAVLSLAHCAVRDVEAVLPQASTALQVLVCDFTQSPVTAPSLCVSVGVPQASVAVAVPSAASIAAEDGLHSVKPVPVAVMVGAVMSNVHVAVRDVEDVLPQPSIAVHDLVCERKHPLV